MTFTEKFLRARPAIEVAGRSVKRYHVTPGPDGVEPEIERAAFAILPRLLPEPDGTPSATFIVVHRSRGDNAAYLNAYSWVWDNVLHFRGAAAAQPIELPAGPDREVVTRECQACHDLTVTNLPAGHWLPLERKTELVETIRSWLKTKER